MTSAVERLAHDTGQSSAKARTCRAARRRATLRHGSAPLDQQWHGIDCRVKQRSGMEGNGIAPHIAALQRYGIARSRLAGARKVEAWHGKGKARRGSDSNAKAKPPAERQWLSIDKESGGVARRRFATAQQREQGPAKAKRNKAWQWMRAATISYGMANP